jgi:hypothetical protein
VARELRQVLVRFPPDELADIDAVRDGVPRNVWIRDLCRDAVLAHRELISADLARDPYGDVEGDDPPEPGRVAFARLVGLG